MTQTSANLVEYRSMLITHADDESWEDRVAAVKAIDKQLLKRNELHLIDGQPSKPIRKQGEPSSKILAFKPKPKAPLRVQGDGRVKNGESVFVNMMKRPSPSTSAEPVVRKKSKLSPCPLCEGNHIALEECPFVRAGASSIMTAVSKLMNEDGDHVDTINALRKILQRLRQPKAESSNPITLQWNHPRASSSTANPP